MKTGVIIHSLLLPFLGLVLSMLINPAKANHPAGEIQFPVITEASYIRSIITSSTKQKLTADVTCIISLTTGGNPAGTVISLTGQEPPFPEYSMIVPQSGIVVFESITEGNYLVDAVKAGFYNYSDAITIVTDYSLEIVLQELRYKPLNLSVDSLTLIAVWDEPKDILIHENFEGSVFPPEGWLTLSQNLTGWYATTDGSSPNFIIPPHSTYAVTNDNLNNGDGCCDYLITPELDLTNLPDYHLNFSGFYTGVSGQIATIELSTDGGGSWNVIHTLSPSPLAWQTVEIDLSAFSGQEGLSAVMLAFHADDSGNAASGWAIDDVTISSGTIPVLGYGVFLDGLLLTYLPDRTYTYNPELIYGMHYTAGVAALYSSGYSEPDNCNFTSRFLFPPLNFDGNIPLYTDYVHLWWDQPENLNDTLTAIPGLSGYNIYRDNTLLDFVAQPLTEYFDMNLNPGIYSYSITAVYDLSSYGYPGETGESMIAGPVEIDNSWCKQLPFNESFNTGLFETNQWGVEGDNWRIAGQVGNQAPSAEFYYSPAAMDYSYALTGFCIDGSGITDGIIRLNFDLKHTLVNATGAEFLAIEVNDGTTWIQVAEYSNIQNLDWLSRSIDITDEVLGKKFQVRFRAYGSNSMDILNWLVDNIRVIRDCMPPRNLQTWIAFPSMNDVLINWEAPIGGGGGPSAWLGWDNGTNNDAIGLTGGGTFSVAVKFTPAQLVEYAGTSLTKMRFFPYAAGTFILKVWTGANAGQLVLTQPLTSVYVGQWNEVALATPVPVTGNQEMWFGYTVTHAANDFPAGVDAGPAVAGFGDMISLDGIVWESMATAYALNYNWNLNAFVEPYDGVTTLQPISDNAVYGPVRQLIRGNLPISPNATVEKCRNEAKSGRDLVGYNVWRDDELICNTTETSYLDMDLMFGYYYCYTVTAIYIDCASEPIDPECILIRDGITKIATDGFMVYPCPAESVINIEPGSDNGYVFIYNYDGQIVYEQSIVEAKSIQLNVSNYETGIYVIRFINSTGESFTRKVVVAR